MILIMSGDVEVNPGPFWPTGKQFYSSFIIYMKPEVVSVKICSKI